MVMTSSLAECDLKENKTILTVYLSQTSMLKEFLMDFTRPHPPKYTKWVVINKPLLHVFGYGLKNKNVLHIFGIFLNSYR